MNSVTLENNLCVGGVKSYSNHSVGTPPNQFGAMNGNTNGASNPNDPSIPSPSEVVLRQVLPSDYLSIPAPSGGNYNGNIVTSTQLTNAGSYPSPGTLTCTIGTPSCFSGTNTHACHPATCVLNTSGTSISKLFPGDPGAGYTTAPAITILGGGGGAASQGPLATTSVISGGWTGFNNIKLHDSVYATYAISAGGNSGDIQATGFAFTIPTGATINGITVTAYVSDISGSGLTSTHDVTLLKAGATVGTPKSSAAPWGVPSTLTFGNGTDLWGTTWTTADTNAAGFGFQMSAHNGDINPATAGIDFVTVTVNYTTSVTNATAVAYIGGAGQVSTGSACFDHNLMPTQAWATAVAMIGPASTGYPRAQIDPVNNACDCPTGGYNNSAKGATACSGVADSPVTGFADCLGGTSIPGPCSWQDVGFVNFNQEVVGGTPNGAECSIFAQACQNGQTPGTGDLHIAPTSPFYLSANDGTNAGANVDLVLGTSTGGAAGKSQYTGIYIDPVQHIAILPQ
jgi:hypothetical protein